jgi:hypothetical protein
MARNALTATEVAVKGENGHVILDRGEIKTLLKEGRIAGVYKYALHERSLPESIGEPDREFPVGTQGDVLLDTRPKAESVISSSEPDRDGDIMRQPGLVITDNYRRNPTVFGLHEHTIPVGFTELLRQYPAFTWARWQWLDDVPQSEGKDYYEMWVKHVLNCTSVGFLINDWAPLEGDNFWGGWDVKEWELLEHSPVSLPSNREAMRTDGLKSLFRKYAERVYDGPSPVLRKMFEETDGEKRPLQIATGGVSGGQSKAKGVISYARAHPDGTPKAAEDAEWDNGKERAAADVEDLKVMCAWVEDDGGENKGDYKFAHHHQSDKAVNKRACSSTIGVLNGARGGTIIPDEDRSGVYAHAKKHLVTDFGVPSADVPALKDLTFDDIRLAAAAGAITVDRAFELVGEIIEDSQLVIAQRDAALEKAEQKVLDLEKEVTNLSAQIVEACG